MNSNKRRGRPRQPSLEELQLQSTPLPVEPVNRLPEGLSGLKGLWSKRYRRKEAVTGYEVA